MRFVSDRGRLRAADVDARVVCRGDEEYPASLEHLTDPPARLWIAGRHMAAFPPCVAIVGSRTPSHYGEEIACLLAADLVQAGMCVVSGLARGIDTCAHIGALDGGTTIAVLAGGIDHCYPASNRELYGQIAEEGALIAEVPPGSPTHKHRFTHRNRIIAALSLAVVVVQATEKSGALSTARHALDLGREVFAVPGDIRLEVSAGVHELLRDGAAVCTSAGDVLERIVPEMERTASMRTLAPIPDELPDSQAEILRRLGGDVMSVDALGAAVGIGGDPLLVAISRLELAGWLTQAPGGLLRRVR